MSAWIFSFPCFFTFCGSMKVGDPSQGKISCKILDTLREKGHFLCKILVPCKFHTRFLQVLQVSCKKGDIHCIQCTFSSQNVQALARYLATHFWKFSTFNNSSFLAFYRILHSIYCNVVHMKDRQTINYLTWLQVFVWWKVQHLLSRFSHVVNG